MNYYIIDGNAYIYRAFFAIPPFTSSKGLYTNAIYGFSKMLLKLMKEKPQDRIIVAFDHKKKSFRHELFENYKAHRAKMPDEMVGQLPYIKQVTELLRLPIMEIEGMEADDAIASFVHQAPKGSICNIITGDKDMMQLVNDHVFIYDTMKNIVYDRDGVKAKMGVWPEQIPDLLGLMGDSADNIPGVSGIGPKTAVTLLEKYTDMEDILANAHNEKGKLGERLRDHAEDARLSKQLATVHTDIDLSHLELREQSPDYPALTELFRELEFYSILKEIGQDAENGNVETATSEKKPIPEARALAPIQTLEAWREAAQELAKDSRHFVHMLTNAETLELMIANLSDGFVYHILCQEEDLRTEVLAFLKQALSAETPLLTSHSKILFRALMETDDTASFQHAQLSLFS
ncbi:hypothetical protein COW46_03905 [Candidatus Gracilibacteria bacterium CG17_big_fil_post_rev_8_21_14_2_50_48_13]|nr:MAG: hypothetical protein COW46_03905 [Candidatus Gracilibacteria bacterium CG17_big_fil_post_rev_8_21_14_2_50_48_13]